MVEKRKKCTSRVLGASECNFRVDRIGWFENQVSSNNYEILEWSKYRKWMIGGSQLSEMEFPMSYSSITIPTTTVPASVTDSDTRSTE